MVTKQFRTKGFTLIEMLTVIAIIGILAGLIIPAASKARRDAAISKAKATISALETALSMYYTDYGAYPPSTAAANQANGNSFLPDASGIIGRDVATTGDNNLVDMLTLTTKGGPYMKFRAEDLLKTGTGASTRYVLKDSWGRAYIYINRSGYTGIIAGPYHPYFDAISVPGLNRNTYNIFSLGPDGRGYGGVVYSGTDWNTSTPATELYDDIQDGDSDNTQSDTDTNNDDDVNNW